MNNRIREDDSLNVPEFLSSAVLLKAGGAMHYSVSHLHICLDTHTHATKQAHLLDQTHGCICLKFALISLLLFDVWHKRAQARETRGAPRSWDASGGLFYIPACKSGFVFLVCVPFPLFFSILN